ARYGSATRASGGAGTAPRRSAPTRKARRSRAPDSRRRCAPGKGWARRAQRRSRVLPGARSRVAPHADFILRAVSHYAWFANDERRTMRAWTVDADDIRVAEDFDEALLH